MKLDKETIVKAQAVNDEVKLHIETFLERLEKEEKKIITPNLEVMASEFCYSIQCFASSFYIVHAHVPRAERVRKSKSDYKILEYKKDGVIVGCVNRAIFIPYEYTEESFRDYVRDFFKVLFADINKALKIKRDYLEELEVFKKKEDSIRRKHRYESFTYWWMDCPRCYNRYIHMSDGEIEVGLGRMEEDPYSDGMREVTKMITCPSCNGVGGFLVFFNEVHSEKKKPCCKDFFKHNEHDFMKLLTEA